MSKHYVDFDGIKQRATMEKAIDFLNLKLFSQRGDQCRYLCPVCKGKDELSINLTSEKFQCFRCHKSGTDSIALVALIKGVRQREAAVILDEAFPTNRAPSRASEPESRREPQEPSEALDMTHPAIEALGLSAAALEALGGGYSEEMKRVVIPLRLPTGVSVGVLGIATHEDQCPLLLFPPDLDDKVKPAKPDMLRKLFRIVS